MAAEAPAEGEEVKEFHLLILFLPPVAQVLQYPNYYPALVDAGSARDCKVQTIQQAEFLSLTQSVPAVGKPVADVPAYLRSELEKRFQLPNTFAIGKSLFSSVLSVEQVRDLPTDRERTLFETISPDVYIALITLKPTNARVCKVSQNLQPLSKPLREYVRSRAEKRANLVSNWQIAGFVAALGGVTGTAVGLGFRPSLKQSLDAAESLQRKKKKDRLRELAMQKIAERSRLEEATHVQEQAAIFQLPARERAAPKGASRRARREQRRNPPPPPPAAPTAPELLATSSPPLTALAAPPAPASKKRTAAKTRRIKKPAGKTVSLNMPPSMFGK